MSYCGIYAIDGPNGFRYVGQAEDVVRRWSAHLHNLERSKANKKLQKDWNEYGPTSFTFKILELCLYAELDNKEQLWLSLWPTEFCYNGIDEEHKDYVRHVGSIKLSDGQIFSSQREFAAACGYVNEASVANAISVRKDTYDRIAARRGVLKTHSYKPTNFPIKIVLSNGKEFNSLTDFSNACGFAYPASVVTHRDKYRKTYEQIAKERGLI